jgi:hypothetical protein
MENNIPLEKKRSVFPLMLQRVIQSNMPQWIETVSPSLKHLELTDHQGHARHNPVVHTINCKGRKRTIRLSKLLWYIFKNIDARIRHDVIHSYVLLYKEVNRTLERNPPDKNLIVYLETKLRMCANHNYKYDNKSLPRVAPFEKK